MEKFLYQGRRCILNVSVGCKHHKLKDQCAQTNDTRDKRFVNGFNWSTIETESFKPLSLLCRTFASFDSCAGTKGCSTRLSDDFDLGSENDCNFFIIFFLILVDFRCSSSFDSSTSVGMLSGLAHLLSNGDGVGSKARSCNISKFTDPFEELVD